MKIKAKNMCYHIAQLLAHVLANKSFIFFQITSIKIILLYMLCQKLIIFITNRIENNRINSVFFSRGRERLDAVNSASTYGASTRINRIYDLAQTKKVPYEIGVTL